MQKFSCIKTCRASHQVVVSLRQARSRYSKVTTQKISKHITSQKFSRTIDESPTQFVDLEVAHPNLQFI